MRIRPYVSSACKDCQRRHTNCHASCEDYRAYRMEVDRVREAMQTDKKFKAYGWNVRDRLCKFSHLPGKGK